MDPISRATLPNIIPATPRVGETAPLAPAVPMPAAGAAAAISILSSTQVDISPLGQFLSGVALSRRQLLALQGATDEARAANTPVHVDDDLLALARQLTESFAQLQTSGIDASQLATAGDTPGSLAQRYDLLSGDGTTGAAAALAQDGSLLTQAGLARIGIDLRNEEVDAATLQAAYAADSNATLNALQQGTDVLAQVGAVLAQRQGALVATAVEADLNGEGVAASAVAGQTPAAQAAVLAQTPGDEPAMAPLDALGQRQLEVRQQMETEELQQDLQEVQQQSAPDAAQLPSATAARAQLAQAGELPAQQAQQRSADVQRQQALQSDGVQERLQTQRTDSERIDAQRIDGERQVRQQVSAGVEQLRQEQVQQTQLQQDQRQEQVRLAADEAVRTQLAADDAQMAARAAGERAQSLAREAQADTDAGLAAATAQAQLAQQNAQAQQLAAQNAGQAVPPPSSQDPSVAAAIAAYNLNNAALNPGLMNRPLPASDSRLPLVAPVAPVEPVKPVNKV
ncbi:hypothetical protein O0880_25110 [Janthinobacterium sp. SUN118]|uniref:hypothetical protein n=1 Tax=Janthinobacterium sp. SUN118 TaxID=3004100 RepID=UPI0025AF4691|nr:hypothetical protein [Janthinobacterium sp. SUN118]MDN2712702.1 hypothetical protein [Janthinobacterium sp. SUN118]